MGLALIAFTLATPIGSAIAGPIFDATGYYGSFGIAAGGSLIALIYTIILYLLIYFFILLCKNYGT